MYVMLWDEQLREWYCICPSGRRMYLVGHQEDIPLLLSYAAYGFAEINRPIPGRIDPPLPDLREEIDEAIRLAPWNQ